MYVNKPRTEPKRVLVVNKFYYRRGGDCVYTLNLEQMLRDHGHEVAVFAMQYPENLDSPWSVYFPREVSFQGSLGQKVHALDRVLGRGDVRDCFARLLRDFRPDVVHLNNIHSYLSPVLAEMAKRQGARVVWTLHDYKLICPSYSCLRDGAVCEECFADSRAVWKRRCMKGSIVASAVAYLEARRWNAGRIQRSVDAFVCPSRFMARKMEQGGYDSGKLTVISNFINISPLPALDYQHRGDYYCYVGRLSPEKGVETLLKAASGVKMKLLVAGSGPLFAELKERYADTSHITFLGQLAGGAVAELLRQARFSVVPSEWYENNPFSIIESLCAGTPVIGADIGGIPELIDPDNGRLFAPGDAPTLAERIREMARLGADGHFDYTRIQADARQRFAADAHYRALLKIY